jgi:hypothetical protein
MADEFKYDVAFSFLGRDEHLAISLDQRLNDHLSTFIYSDAKRQTFLTGSDGAEAFSRVFGREARTVVVLYRQGWGEQGFTETECTAIRNRAFEYGWDFTTFIPLDDPPTVPVWLPRTRLWHHLKRLGEEHAVTVIEARVQEAGGNPREPTVAEIATRLIAERKQAHERASFLNSPDGVAAARREFDTLFEEVKRACAESSGLLVLCPQREKVWFCMQTPGVSRKITFYFDLALNNSLQGFKLNLIDYDGTIVGRDSNHQTEYHFDFGPLGEHGWRRGTTHGKGDFFATPRFADDLAKKMIDPLDNRQRRPTPRIW